MEQATLRLSGDRKYVCELPPGGALLQELLGWVRTPAQAKGKTVHLRTPGGASDEAIPAQDVTGIEIAPPFCVVRDFLTPAERDEAAAHIAASAAKFEDATISLPSTQNESQPEYRLRRSRILNDIAPMIPLVMPKLHSLMPQLWGKIGIPPNAVSRLECQITAHGDGDFFETHTDNALPDIAHRVVSFVCYVHKEPKRFSGGRLRFYNTLVESGGQSCGAVSAEIDPPGNCVIVFPAGCYHEVTPITSTATDLPDQRLTINGWLCR